MVGRGQGKFHICNHPSHREFLLNIRHGHLTGLYIDKAPIDDILQVRLWLGELLRSDMGDFDFQRATSLEMEALFNLPLDQLILSSLSEIVEEQTFVEHFPDPNTVFEPTGQGAIWVDRNLEHFFELARPYLITGSSARDLGDFIEMPRDYILLCLYKLRSAGVIRPRRAFVQPLVDAPVHDLPPPIPPARGLIDVPQPGLGDRPRPGLITPRLDRRHPLPSHIPDPCLPADPEPPAPVREPQQLSFQPTGLNLLSRLITGIRRTFGQTPG
jgi:hypothetical protein